MAISAAGIKTNPEPTIGIKLSNTPTTPQNIGAVMLKI